MHRSAAAFACALALACSRKEPPPKPAPDAGPLARIDTNDPKALLAAVDQMQGQLKDKPKTFEVLSALGNLYYDNGRHLDAVDSFRQALAISAPAEARARELRDEKVKPAKDLPLECRRSGPGYGLEQIAAAARKLDGPRELRCLDSALEMAVDARARRGNALYLVGSPDGALAEHRRVLAGSPDHPESLFFVGAITLEQSRGDAAKLAEGKKYWQRLLAVAPDSPRAPLVKDSLPRVAEIFAPKPQAAAGGEARMPPGHPDLSAQELQAVAEAARNTERTAELEKGLDELTAQAESLLDQGKYQEARDAIVRVMPMRPDDARTAAAMGAAMRGLGRQEMAERTLARALQLDPRQSRALYEMGKLLAGRGDKAGAAEKLRAAQSADPQFAQSHQIAQELARLR
jgi:tetratricopeptide (TPR) repeat protein